MAATGNDCHFFYTSTCTKGKDCTFRHSEPALGCEITCVLWRKGVCTRQNCKFRHKAITSAFRYCNRAIVPCYYENQPDGCTKADCPFLHKKEKVPALETSQNNECASNVPCSTESSSNLDNPEHNGALPEFTKKGLNPPRKGFHLNSPSIPPVVVNTADNEESDGELTTELSSKLQNKISVVCSDVPRDSSSIARNDLGIKTLEQLRIDKVMMESSHFYGPANVAVSSTYVDLDDPGQHRVSQEYRPQSPPPNDLRDILLRKRNARSESQSPPPTSRRVISFKKSLNNDDKVYASAPPRKVRSVVDRKSTQNGVKHDFEDKGEVEKKKCRKHAKGSLDFHVKSLAEIRTEKEKRKLELSEREIGEDVCEKKMRLSSVANMQFAQRSVQLINKPMSLNCNRPIGNYKPPAKRNCEAEPMSSQYTRPSVKQNWNDCQKLNEEGEKLSADLQASVQAAKKLKKRMPTQPVYTIRPRSRRPDEKKPSSSTPLDLEKLADEASPSKQSYLGLRSAFASKRKTKANQVKPKEVVDTPTFRKLNLDHFKVSDKNECNKNEVVKESVKIGDEMEDSTERKLSPVQIFQEIQVKTEPQDKYSEDDLSLHAFEVKGDDLLLPLLSEDKIKKEVHSESSSTHSDENPKLNDKDLNCNSTLSSPATDSEIRKECNDSTVDSEQNEVNKRPQRVSENSCDFDAMLTKECDLDLEDLNARNSEKVDDLFSEIEKILED